MITRGDFVSLFIMTFLAGAVYEVRRGSGLLPEQITRFLRSPAGKKPEPVSAAEGAQPMERMPEIRGFVVPASNVIQ